MSETFFVNHIMVVPAQAGVIPHPPAPAGWTIGGPRTGGGDPTP